MLAPPQTALTPLADCDAMMPTASAGQARQLPLPCRYPVVRNPSLPYWPGQITTMLQYLSSPILADVLRTVTSVLRARGSVAAAHALNRSFSSSTSSTSTGVAAASAGNAVPPAAPWITQLGSRAVICMEGRDCLQFLQVSW